VALIGSIAAATYRGTMADSLPTGLAPDVRASAEDTIDAAVAVAARLPVDLTAPVLDAARTSFTTGLTVGALVAAVIAAAAAVIALVQLRHMPPSGTHPGESAPTTQTSATDAKSE
jgi:DHA2 family multidrug resistance protein-like MFS transporter